MPDPDFIQRSFGPDHARVYDNRFTSVEAIKDALHLFIQAHLRGLPDDARILVVGAGTGAEVRHLAPRFPGWHFTLVDPADAMLAVARQHAQAEGFADRCTFHVGFLDSAPSDPHHAALSVLASQFLTDPDERRAYFRDIHTRLQPGGRLFTADLVADRSDPALDTTMDLWLDVLEHAGPVDRTAYRGIFGTAVSDLGLAEVQQLLVDAGFLDAVPCVQLALIRGWVATRG